MSRPSFRLLIPLAAAVPLAPAAYAVQYLTIGQAQHQAFPGADEFRPVAIARDALTAASSASGVPAPQNWSPRVFEAREREHRIGWLIVDQVIGKTEAITYSVAISPQGTVTALEILDYREEHGGEVRLPAWRRQFVGKRSADRVAIGGDIRNISGATLSCRHVTEGVRRALRLFDRLPREGS